MRQRLRLGDRKHSEWCGEYEREKLERDQLRERLINVTAVAKAESEVLDGDPQTDAGSVDILRGRRLSCLQAIDLSKEHQNHVDDLERSVIEQ